MMTGCAGQRPNPSTTPPGAGSPSQGSLLKPTSVPQVFVIPAGIPEWQRRLLMDVNEQKNELETLYIFTSQELAMINRGQIRNDFPYPLDLSEFYEIKANYAKDLASLEPRQRGAIYAFYGTLAQINSYQLQRESLPYRHYSNVPQQVQTLDQLILSEIAAARSVDFSWIQ